MTSPGDNARHAVDEIIARTHTADFYLEEATEEINGVIQELLILGLGGTNSEKLRGATILAPQVNSDIEAARVTISSIRSNIEDYRRTIG